jgi:molybdenum cofactor cytidylyltransferase
MNKCASVILAAGLSSRMTAFKPLLKVGDITLTDRLISTYQKNGADVILVTGWRKEQLQSGIKSRDVRIVDNPDFQNGMFTSVQAGVRALDNRYSCFFIQPVDIPMVRPYTIKLLTEAHGREPDRIIYPVFDGHRGHPVLIPASLTSRILASRPEGGLKTVLELHSDLTMEVQVADRHIIFDVDTPEDFQELQERFGKYEIPTTYECEVILNDLCGVSEEIQKHGRKVAQAAEAIAQALERKGISVDIDLVRTGGLLHDIAKGQHKHDEAGGRLLREMGFGRVGNIVAVHTDLPREINDWESRILYLADKFIKGTQRVTLSERYDPTARPFKVTLEIEAQIVARRKRAEEVKTEFEKLLGYPLESLVF